MSTLISFYFNHLGATPEGVLARASLDAIPLRIHVPIDGSVPLCADVKEAELWG
jgi:hypothetical protein